MNERRITLAIALALILMAVVLRLAPHPANFAPVTAIALFGGAVLSRKLALWVPLAAMVVSDIAIGFYDIMPVIWGCYFLTALASSVWLRKPSFVKGAALTLGASIGFFLVTNFAVWAASGMYDHTIAGFIQCYTMALPFFRNTLLSDAVYTSVLFGMFVAARHVATKAAYLMRPGS